MDEIDDLFYLSEKISEISGKTHGRDATWREVQASLVFAKLGITTMTLLKCIPGSPYYAPAGKYAIWDLSSVVSLSRTLTETYYVLCYLSHKPTEQSEQEFQQLLWVYHEQFERYEMVATTIPDSKYLPSLRAELEERRKRLEQSPPFLRLSSKFQMKILDEGKAFKLPSSIELSKLVSISEAYYRGQYKYCSAYAHCAPFSISQLDKLRADSPEATELFKFPMRMALGYSALAIREFTAMFPDVKSNLDPRTLKLIDFWSEILKWDNQPGFRETEKAADEEPSP